LFYLVTLTFWFSMYTCVPILASYLEYLGASYDTIGLIIGMYGLTQLLLRIPVGVVSDRYHKRRIFITFGLMFSLLSGIGIVFAQEVSWILILRALAGAAAATWVDFTILFSSYFAKEHTTKAIGNISFFSTVGQMVGILSGGWFAAAFGFESAFIVGGIAGAIGLVLSFFLIENTDISAEKITLKGVLEVASDSILLRVSFVAILSQIMTFATVFGFTPVFAQSLGAGEFEMGLLTFFSTFPTAVAGMIGGGFLSSKYGEKKVVIFGFLLVGVFTVIIPYVSSITTLIITQTFAGFGRGFVMPILMALSIKHIEQSRRSTAMGFYQAIYGVGMFIGPILMGLLIDWRGLETGFVFMGVLGFLTAFLSYKLIKLTTPSSYTDQLVKVSN